METVNWHEINLQDKNLFETYLNKRITQGHEYTFANFYTHRKNKQHRYAEYKGHLIVANTSVSENWQVYEPLGKSPENVIRAGLPIENGYEWTRISSETIQKLLFREGLNLDRDNHDYVHSVDELVSMKGKKYDGKRNFIRRFCNSYSYTVVPLTKDTIQDCYQFAKDWSEQKGMKDGADLIPLNEVILNYSHFSFSGIGIYVEDKMVGFAMGEPLAPGVFGERYEKAFTEFTGIYPVLLHELAKYLQGKYHSINREQDLGIPGLRKSKQSWHPKRYVAKYSLTGDCREKVVFENDRTTIYESKVPNSHALKTLYRACNWSVIDRAPEKLAHGLKHSDTVLSAWKGKQLIGVANAISDRRLVVYFPHLLVHPDHQKTGIGKSLMNIMLEKYGHCDQKIVISHKDAIQFYEKLGFANTTPHAGMWIHNSPDL